MSDSPLLPLGSDASLDARQERFQEAWLAATAGGTAPRWEDFLPPAGQPCPPDFMVLLLQTDVEYQLKLGRLAPLVYSYWQHTRLRNGDLRLDDAQLLELIHWEYAQRWKQGDRARRAEYVAWFPHLTEALQELTPRWNCPDCKRTGIPLADEAAETDVCPFCRTTISVVRLFAPSPPPVAPASGPPLPPLTPQAQRIRCPHCHNPILLLDDHSDDVLCPGCGSSFRVCAARHTETVSASRPLGKFHLLERVGVGAFGAVWRARDTELDRIVALKIPHTGLVTSDNDLERFHREARAAAQLRHPGIVTVHEVVTLEGLPTIVSDFVAGVPLNDLLEVRRLTFRETAELVAEAAEALHYAHTMGLVHRDIKPANIMIERSKPAEGVEKERSAVGKPLLLDFGLALRNEAEITMTLDGHIIGTPAYMSPEQAAGKGHVADRRSDVYSLGVVLYELIMSWFSLIWKNRVVVLAGKGQGSSARCGHCTLAGLRGYGFLFAVPG